MTSSLSLFGAYDGATISPCGLYRYVLRRQWGPRPPVNFILLNPSTADAIKPDPTMTRCVNYARAWDKDGIVITNLFAFRSSEPRDLRSALDPIGPQNDLDLITSAHNSCLIVCGWGADPFAEDQACKVKGMLRERGYANKTHVLRLTKSGAPGHPLYLPKNLTPQVWDLGV